MPKIVEAAKKDLKLTVKIGTPTGIVSFQSDPSFLGVMGLVVSALDSDYKRGRSNPTKGLLQKVKRWVRPFIP
jgi:cell division ATPase FtsA